MRHRAGSVLIAIGTLLLIAAAGFLVYNQWDDWRAGESVAEIQDALENAKETKSQEKQNPLTAAVEADEAVEDTEGYEMATVEVEGYAYIGTLSIPRYGLELPVMSEWSYPGLKIAPGRYSGSVWNDDLVICGHNYERHFGNLKQLETGDEIAFTDVDGNAFSYVVDEVIILQPTDVEEMLAHASAEWDLTLFTCTLGGQSRVTVRCSRADEF